MDLQTKDPSRWQTVRFLYFKLSLSHESIPKILDHYDLYMDGRHDYCLVEEYLLGCTLEVVLGRNSFDPSAPSRGFIAKKEYLRLCFALFSVFDYLHSKKVVHRDLKPANIYL